MRRHPRRSRAHGELGERAVRRVAREHHDPISSRDVDVAPVRCHDQRLRDRFLLGGLAHPHTQAAGDLPDTALTSPKLTQSIGAPVAGEHRDHADRTRRLVAAVATEYVQEPSVRAQRDRACAVHPAPHRRAGSNPGRLPEAATTTRQHGQPGLTCSGALCEQQRGDDQPAGHGGEPSRTPKWAIATGSPGSILRPPGGSLVRCRFTREGAGRCPSAPRSPRRESGRCSRCGWGRRAAGRPAACLAGLRSICRSLSPPSHVQAVRPDHSDRLPVANGGLDQRRELRMVGGDDAHPIGVAVEQLLIGNEALGEVKARVDTWCARQVSHRSQDRMMSSSPAFKCRIAAAIAALVGPGWNWHSDPYEVGGAGEHQSDPDRRVDEETDPTRQPAGEDAAHDEAEVAATLAMAA